MTRDIDDVVQALRNARDEQTGATLLIGAGCSVKAGIPLAAGFVERFRDRFPRDYERAKEKTYAHCMGELTPGQRRDLIASYVREAKVNWAHVCIAALMREGYVDRVLTTNFDNLVVRACAMLGEFPAVYDLAGSQLFKAADIPRKALFYLHGQHTGFVLRNTPNEVQEQSKSLGPVFDDNGRRRTWMVVGYSGLHDPVFEHLASVPQFDYGLYWAGYQDQEPAEHIRSRLLLPDRYAYHVGGYDADSFFVTLCQKLRIFPPGFLSDPFSYVEGILESLTPYTLPGQTGEEDVTRSTRARIQKAREVLDGAAPLATDVADGGATSLDVRITNEFMAGNYDEVAALALPVLDRLSAEAVSFASWAFVMIGSGLAGRASSLSGEEADRLFVEAGENYETALRIRPNMSEALYEWGDALSKWAKQKEGEEADRRFAWAGEKYQAAVKVNPNSHVALFKWGATLADQAERKQGEDADRLFAAAGEKFEAALKIKPDDAETLFVWGNRLLLRAKQKEEEEADRLFALAGEKYEAALRAKPDMHAALTFWGMALSNWARRKKGEEADRLIARAEERYRAALAVKPDDFATLHHLAALLLSLTAPTDEQRRQALYTEVEGLLRRVEAIQPGRGAYNFGCLYARLGEEDQAREWLERSRAAGMLPNRAHLLSDPDLESVRGTPWFQQLVAEAKD